MSTATTNTTYAAEIAFLNRAVPTAKIKWETLPVMSQIVSPPLPEAEATSLVGKFKDTLGKRAGALFTKMFFTTTSKLRGGTRIAISVQQLREVFAREIDGDSGGGGRSYNPFQNRPMRGGM